MERSSMCSRRLFYLFSLCLCSVLLLAGCGGAPARPTALPDLHGPGVSQVTGVDDLLPNRPGYDLVNALGTYRLPDVSSSATTSVLGVASPTPLATDVTHVRIVMAVGPGANSRYYDIGMDGSNPHPLSLRVPCSEHLTITLTGSWGACVTTQGIATFRLLPTAASSALLEEHVLLANNPSYGYGDLSWDPTGHYLAVARVSPRGSPDDTPAPLDVFAVSTSYDQARLVIRFGGAFAFSELRWSPDGRWLFVVSTSGGQLHLVPVWRFVTAWPTFDAPTQYLTLSSAQLRVIPHDVVWRPGSSFQWTWMDADGVLYQQDLTTGQIERLVDLGFPPPNEAVAGACAATWTADGRSLILALCAPDGEWPGLPPKLFVYTVPSD